MEYIFICLHTCLTPLKKAYISVFIQNYKEGENCYECSFIDSKYCFGRSFSLDLTLTYS